MLQHFISGSKSIFCHTDSKSFACQGIITQVSSMIVFFQTIKITSLYKAKKKKKKATHIIYDKIWERTFFSKNLPF